MNRPRWIAGLLIVLALAVVGAYVAYDQVLRGDSVEPLGFSTPSPSGATATGGPGSSSATASGNTASLTPGDSVTADALAGNWTVGSGSEAGYRVREKLASLPAQSDAVGRTSSITGSATIVVAGSSVRVTAASFQADLTTLTSDRSMRDQRIHSIGLESDRFPTGKFTLTSPLDVPAGALTGAIVDVTLTGDLELHGVTKSVTIAAQARHSGDRLEVVGSLTFPFADFGMTPPSIGNFVSVESDATLEFRISLAKG